MSGRRHHFIPQFLQRGFASNKTNKGFYTWMYRKDELNPSNPNIKNVGIQVDFYSEDNESTLDDLITDAENEYAPYVEELRGNDGTKEIDRKKAALLIAHLEGRTKSLRDSFRNAGTLLLGKVTEYLKDDRNCEKFVKIRVDAEADSIIEERLKEAKIPKTLIPLYKPKCMSMIKEKIPEMTADMAFTMRQLSQNMGPLLEKSAKSGQIKALISNHSPPIKASAYEKLDYQVISTGGLVMPLGDSAVIFHIEGEPAFKPYYEVDRKLLAVLLPISSNQLLVGATNNYEINLDVIKLAIATCSSIYFISNQQSSENDDLAKHISETAAMISEAEIQDILSSLVSTI